MSLREINQYRKDNLHPKYVSLKLASFTGNLSQAIHGSTLTKKQSIAKKYKRFNFNFHHVANCVKQFCSINDIKIHLQHEM